MAQGPYFVKLLVISIFLCTKYEPDRPYIFFQTGQPPMQIGVETEGVQRQVAENAVNYHTPGACARNVQDQCLQHFALGRSMGKVISKSSPSHPKVIPTKSQPNPNII